jgi:AcrR family transcriptional regulator
MHTEKTDKKDQIIHAALELFGKQGYEGTSIRDICQEANVNLAMVNYYFGSKEGLFAAMIERKASAIKDRLQELVNNETMTPQEKIDSVIERYVDRLFSHRGFSLTMMRELSKDQRQPLHEAISSIFMVNMEMIRAIILEGQKKKVFREVDVDLTISTIMGTLWNLIINHVMVKKICGQYGDNPYDDPVFRKRVATHLKDLINYHLTRA